MEIEIDSQTDSHRQTQTNKKGDRQRGSSKRSLDFWSDVYSKSPGEHTDRPTGEHEGSLAELGNFPHVEHFHLVTQSAGDVFVGSEENRSDVSIMAS